jgi:predicted nucleic-acid-binding Zn-ribbon protein
VNFAPVDTYVCVNCGYVESYIAHPEKLSYIADHWA